MVATTHDEAQARSRPIKLSESGWTAILLGLFLLYYVAPGRPLSLLLLALCAVACYIRLPLAVSLVPLAMPFFMLPKELGHPRPEFALGETAIVLCTAAFVARLGYDAVSGRTHEARETLRRLVPKTLLARAVVVFLIAATVATVAAFDRHDALRAYREWILEPIIYYGLVVCLLRDARSLARSLWALAGSGLVVAALGIGQYLFRPQTLTGYTYAGTTRIPLHQISSVYGSPDNLALLLDRALPVALVLGLAAFAQSRLLPRSRGREKGAGTVQERAWERGRLARPRDCGQQSQPSPQGTTPARPADAAPAGWSPRAQRTPGTGQRPALPGGRPSGYGQLFQALGPEGEGIPWLAYLAWLGVVVMAVADVLSGSRGGMITAAAVAVFAALLWRGRLLDRSNRLLALGGVAAVIVGAVAVLLKVQHGLSTNLRVLVWESALKMIRDHPILGVGPDNFLSYYFNPRIAINPAQPGATDCLPAGVPLAGTHYMSQQAWREPCLSHPHNVVLDAWLSTGIVGLIALVAIVVGFILLARGAWRAHPAGTARAVLVGAVAVVAATLVHGLVDNSIFVPDLAVAFWLALALVQNLGQGATPSIASPGSAKERRGRG